jgi:hypothetical protein
LQSLAPPVRTTSIWARVPLHAHAIALAPVLSMYGANPGSIERGDLAASAAAVLAVATALLLLAGAAYRDLQKGAIFASVLLIIFLGAGAAYDVVENWEVAGARIGRRRYVVPLVYAAVAVFAFWLARIQRRFATLTVLANIVTVGALLPPAFRIAHTEARAINARRASTVLEPLEKTATPALRPDIYYVVFDRYGDERTVQEYGVDNRPLYEYLERTGFFVARASRSNYINTMLSLASSLNMTYLDGIARAYGEESRDWRPVHDLIHSHRVGAFLRAHGYQYVHFGSWHPSTRENPQATRNVNYHVAVPRSTMRLLDNVLFDAVRHVVTTPLLDHRRQHWNRIRRQVDDAIGLASEPGPKFVFLHLLVPHQPYVFDRDGRFVSQEEENRRSRRENYANQVRAANLMIRRLVEGVLQQSPSPPVIIVQGDEGPYPDGTEHEDYEWIRAAPAILRQRSGILNAYLLPGADSGQVYPHISPVNSFRVVFNTYLGTRLPLLPDRTIAHGSNRVPLVFTDITDVVAQPRAAAVATSGSMP